MGNYPFVDAAESASFPLPGTSKREAGRRENATPPTLPVPSGYSMHVNGRWLLIEPLPCSVIVPRARSVVGGVDGGGGGVVEGERDWEREGEGEGDDGIE